MRKANDLATLRHMLFKAASLRKYVHYNALVAWRTRDFWVRAVLCWMIGAVLLVNDEASDFDTRLKIRGAQAGSSKIILIDLNERELVNLDPESRNVLRPLNEIVTLSDAYFWNPRIWEKLLNKILEDQPTAIGISFFFGENIHSTHLADSTRAVFQNPRIIWGADTDNAGHLLTPQFADFENSNIGLRGMRPDEDGTVRRFVSNRSAPGESFPENNPEKPPDKSPGSGTVRVAELGIRLTEAALGQDMAGKSRLQKMAARYRTPTLINYRGDGSSFTVITAKDVIEGRVPPQTFRDKLVIVGSLSSPLEEMQTPLGRMSRSEVLANIVDDALGDKTIHRLPAPVYFALLALLMVAAIWVLSNYPQSVTLAVFVMSGIVWTALSVWSFDQLYLWIPVLSPLVQLTATCIVYLSYQLAINERRTWRLEQEQLYLSEIEQLKSNFVSMMSHDLKTPIAKIQAICDRRLATALDADFTMDLKNLRRSSDELHRYIQSILQVTKVEAKDFKILKEVTDINENIERVVSRLQPLAREKGLRIETLLEPMFSIEADTNLIQEVIHNLVENALKYTQAQGSERSPAKSAGTPSKVTITSQEKDDNVVVVVEDTGSGIDPADQKDVWKKFTRGRALGAGASEIRGTGLGLYLVKYFVELHGGQVFLESALGQGTRIGFSIPIKTSEVDSEATENFNRGK